MVLSQADERARIKRLKVEQAINMAMQSRWSEAADLNRQIIEDHPKDVEAFNRLGKALMELARFDEARDAYQESLRLDPTNAIAGKNLQRLDKLIAERGVADIPTGPLDPSMFIEETGRATSTNLIDLAAPEVLAKLDAGDPVTLEVRDNAVLALGPTGETLGKLEPKLRQRLMRLLNMGNQYGAVVTSVDEGAVRIMIRETHRDPSMGNRPSFPTTGEAFRGYVRDTLLRYGIEEEEEEEEEEEALEEDHDVILHRESDIIAEDEGLPGVPDLSSEEDES